MSEIVSQVQSSGLDIRLTSEKLFINSSVSTETFALRSIDGIGVVDLVEEYDKELSIYNSKQMKGFVWLFIGISIVLFALYNLLQSFEGTATLILFVGAIPSAIGVTNLVGIQAPKLMSAVRIMMSGGSRDFKFDKEALNRAEIAAFVAKIEETLTAYHKNKS
jgi:hypothetical protein